MSMASERIGYVSNLLWELSRETPKYFYDLDFRSNTADERAKNENRRVVLPKDNELFIDIDNDLQFLTFEKNYEMLVSFYESDDEPRITDSPSGDGHKHIVVTLKNPIDPMERLLLQAILGSDLRREFLGLQRIKINDPRPTLFLEPNPEQPPF